MRNALFILVLVAAFTWLFAPHRQVKVQIEDVDSVTTVTRHQVVTPSIQPRQMSASEPVVRKPVEVATTGNSKSQSARPDVDEQKKKKLALHYVIDEGVAVVLGDVVIGRPTQDNTPASGMAEVPSMSLWPNGNIPFYIQPSLSNPDRVLAALAFFDGTNIHFTPYTNEDNALVFQESTGVCKSYVGMIGGKQPVWISRGCGSSEIAHEILHALGFIHEQNRTDRDSFIEVHFENIDDAYKFNFEKLPIDFMKVTGLASFNFDSIMLYPVWMFVKGGQFTMESKVRDQDIRPGTRPSPVDMERANRAYAR
jgi:hypothetical protein